MSDDEIITFDDDDDDEGSAVTPEWKKKKVDDDERLTLRIDALEADRWQAKRNKMQADIKRTKSGKISKKVRQLYDDDENEEDGFDEDVERSFRELRRMQAENSNGDNTLIDALAPSERLIVEQRAQLQTLKQQENAGKLNAIQQADALARRAGLDRSQTADEMKKINEAVYNPRHLRTRSLEDTIAKQTGIEGKITPKSEGKVADGVKQVQKTTENHKAHNIKIEDAKSVSSKNMSANQTAELILRKSGQEAKLTELKKQNAYNGKFASEKAVQKPKDFEYTADQDNNKTNSKKSYKRQVNDLLKDSLKKNNASR